MKKLIVWFDQEDKKRKGMGVAMTSRGKVMIPINPVKLNQLCLVELIDEKANVILVNPVRVIPAQAGITLTTEKGAVLKISSNLLLDCALHDLIHPIGDKWWRGLLATRLTPFGGIGEALESLNPKGFAEISNMAVKKVREVGSILAEVKESLYKNDFLEIFLEAMALTGRKLGEPTCFHFSVPIKLGFYLEVGMVKTAKDDLFGGFFDKIGLSPLAYCSGLKGYWENVTSFACSRSARIAINSEAQNGMMTYAISRATGGSGWIECDNSFMDTVMESEGL